MLSAFQARPIVDLKQRDKSKIESILAYGEFYQSYHVYVQANDVG